MTVSIIVAIAENGVIGRDNGLPWRLSTDMKRFKALTMGKPIVMGRKTWESFPNGALPGRRNVVVTRDRTYDASDAEVFTSLEAALGSACAAADEAFIIGGGQIYAQGITLADRLHVTHVATAVEGDTRFPQIDPDVWRKVHEERVPAGERDDFATAYAVYERHRSVP